MKLNKTGFTLIELLAVITIMGILLLVAIPAISRTIENSRRDTFADVAKEYIGAVRNAVLADEIRCGDYVASGTADGTYYLPIDSSLDTTKDLMESGGKSPFGSADVTGYVKWVKSADSTTGKTKTEYFIALVDSSKHGLVDSSGKAAELGEGEIGRSAVSTKVDGKLDKPTGPGDSITMCKLA